MAGPAARPGHEELLAQREWVRGLARALAAGPDADDLEQETMAAALRSPPRSGGYPRAWLATVLRNFARREGRSGARRARREEAAARPEAADDPADVVARAEAHGRVVEAVLALGEPARTAVLLRFYDGLPPREVARATGVPPETARSRLKRALADLRERLGGERGREGLLPALLPLLGRPEGLAPAGTAAGVAGGIAMGAAAKVGLAAGVLALGAGGVVAWQALREPPGEVEAPPPAAAAQAPAPPPADAAAEEASAAVPPAPPPPAPEAKPSREDEAEAKRKEAERVERILGTLVEEMEFRGVPLTQALAEVARRVGLGTDYEGEGVRNHCASHSVPPMKFRGIPFRDAVNLLLRTVPPPGPKPIGFEVRGDVLFLLLADPPPPPKESEEEAQRRKAAEEKMLERLRTERTSFAFDGQNVQEALQYLAARHGINFVVEEGAAGERCRALTVKATVKDVSLEDGLAEVLRVDPDLYREVRGNVVLVRKR